MCFRPTRYSQARDIRRQQGGYVLVLMLVFVVVGSLYGLLDRLNANAAETSRVSITNQALKQARDALIAYAATYPDRNPGDGFGYLPCPDMAGDDVLGTMIGTGAGSCGSSNASVIGLLPYRTLGLPELRDGDGNCLWYAVSGSHKANPKSTSTLSETTVAQFKIMDTAGTILVDNTSVDPGHGAAAIIFAAGAPLSGQTRNAMPSKSCATDSTQASAYLESQGPTFIAGVVKSSDGSTQRNDQLSWITSKDTFSLAKKRPDYTPSSGGGGGGDGDDDDD